MEVDRFGKFLVAGIYCIAGLCLIAPVVILVVDPGDPGHLVRFILCPLIALGVAVVGKAFSCLVVVAQSRTIQSPEENPSEDSHR